ncbi:MAG: LytTR family transcriptional regulator DNA-binding domain-containing protein [Lachnospiraceae bacterium]|nr:LytTR family transcriptional regulator DNA-binding domain-containing protein [Lachnospiraceae bacterium]
MGVNVRVNYNKDISLQEDKVDIHYREENEQLEIIRNFFSSLQSITGKKDDEVCILHPGSIYYLEVVDRKLFAYQVGEIYQLDYSMKQFLDCFGANGFVQISKNTIVNLYRVKKVKTDLNMRLKLVMDNEEMLILNRTYKKNFLDALYHIREVYHEDHQ